MDALSKAIKEAQKTGKRQRKVFNRAEFIRQFPDAATDPRMAFTPKNFILDITPLEPIDVGTLREICIKKGDHPLAIQKALSVQGLADNVIVSILKEDMEVLTGVASDADDRSAITRANKMDNPPSAPVDKAAKPPKK